MSAAASSFLIVKGDSKDLSNQTSITPTPSIIRKASVAGTFYPSDKNQLESELNSYLSKASLLSEPGKLRILIVPHAGIDFSGATAAWGFKQLEGKSYSRVIILGASHNNAYSYISVFSSGAWETPLGKNYVDEVFASALLDKENGIINDINVQKNEHSLEIELLFLQKVLKNFKIVPILIGQTEDKTLTALSQKIFQNFDEDTLLVISSDLSHYPSYESANEIDKKTINSILSGDESKFEEVISDIEGKNYPGVVTAACGNQAISVGLKLANLLDIKNIKKINYSNSGDVVGDKSGVVGYSSIGFWSDKISKNIILGDSEKKEALKIASDALNDYIKNKKIPQLNVRNGILNIPLGAFVTLRKSGQLRGCIGSFEAKDPLAKVIQDMTISAATNDIRFQPVTADELSDISIEISVLTPRKRIESWREIVLGRDGVVVQKSFAAGTFLPQVASESGWNLEQFLSELCTQKAGFEKDCYKDPSVTLYTFEAQVFK